MRRNIFEIINQNNNFGYDIDRIKRLTEDENIIHYYYEQSLFDSLGIVYKGHES